jgi:hypothetical protein
MNGCERTAIYLSESGTRIKKSVVFFFICEFSDNRQSLFMDATL